MSYPFNPGDDLIFQLESGFGLLRVLAVEGEGADTVWHLLAYDEFFPDVESAEAALAQRDSVARAQSTHGAHESRLRTHARRATRQPPCNGRRTSRLQRLAQQRPPRLRSFSSLNARHSLMTQIRLSIRVNPCSIFVLVLFVSPALRRSRRTSDRHVASRALPRQHHSQRSTLRNHFRQRAHQYPDRQTDESDRSRFWRTNNRYSHPRLEATSLHTQKRQTRS